MEEKVGFFISGLMVGMFLLLAFMVIGGFFSGVNISHETANKLCENITGSEYAVGYDWQDYPASAEMTPFPKGGFSCVINKPTFDHTNLIHIKD